MAREEPKQIEGFSKTVSEILTKETDELKKTFPFLEGRFEGFEPSGMVSGPEFDAFTRKIRFPKLVSKIEDASKLESLDREGVVKGGAIDAGFRGTVIHEIGHGIDHAIKIDLPTDDLRNEYHDAKQRLRVKVGDPSRYGSTNLSEWVAERLLLERLGKADPELSALMNEFGSKLKPLKKKSRKHSEPFQSFASGWQGPFEGERGGTYWISPSGEKSYVGPQGDEDGGTSTDEQQPDDLKTLAKQAANPERAAGVAGTIERQLADVAADARRYDNPVDRGRALAAWDDSAQKVGIEGGKVKGFLSAIASGAAGAAGNLVKYLASLPVTAFKNTLKAIGDLAIKAIRGGTRIAGGLGLHLAGIAVGAAIAASPLLLPASIPFAVKLLAAIPMAWVAKRVISKVGKEAGNVIDPQQATFRRQGVQTRGLRDVNRQSESYERFAGAWQGPFEGERGGTYWISPSGEKNYEGPGEEKEAKSDADNQTAEMLWKNVGPSRSGLTRWQNQDTGKIVYGRQPKEPDESEKARRSADRRVALYTPSKTEVSPALQSELSSRTKDLFGDKIKPETIHKIFGLEKGVTAKVAPLAVSLGAGVETKGISCTLQHPDVNQWRRSVWRNPDGTLEVRNDIFMVKPRAQGNGFGVKAFGNQVEASIAAGVDKITTLAGKGVHGSQKMNGYYTWARFGYDAPLEAKFQAGLPVSLKGAKTVQDLMATEEGRNHWKTKGYATFMTFDLHHGSRSLKVFNAYRKAKGLPPLKAGEQNGA